jgi:hypothetical protein
LFFTYVQATIHKYCKYLQFFFDASIIGPYVGISMFRRSNAYIGASGRPKARASEHLRMVLRNPPQPLCSSNHAAAVALCATATICAAATTADAAVAVAPPPSCRQRCAVTLPPPSQHPRCSTVLPPSRCAPLVLHSIIKLTQ